MKLYQVDAFTSSLFRGNPAAVVPLERWLDDALLQNIAQENNLSETAFLVPDDTGYALRWFTPRVEVDLCGHATLAAAWVVFNRLLKSPLRAQSFRLVRNLGALLKVYVHPSKKRNNECGPAWMTRRARPEAHSCCALPLGKGTTLTIETRRNSCTLQATLSMQGVFQRFPNKGALL